MTSVMNCIRHMRKIIPTLQKVLKKTEAGASHPGVQSVLLSWGKKPGDSFHLPSDTYLEEIPGFLGMDHSDRQVSHIAQVATLCASSQIKVFISCPLYLAYSP